MNPVFLYGCIPARLGLTFVAKQNPQLLTIITALISIGFFTIYLFDLRKTGVEVGGKKIWWNHLRPLHGLLFGVFSIMSYYGDKNAWILLLLDTIIGFIAFWSHYERDLI